MCALRRLCIPDVLCSTFGGRRDRCAPRATEVRQGERVVVLDATPAVLDGLKPLHLLQSKRNTADLDARDADNPKLGSNIMSIFPRGSVVPAGLILSIKLHVLDPVFRQGQQMADKF